MALLPPDGQWKIQQIGGQVVLWREGDEYEVTRFDPSDAASAAVAQAAIALSDMLTDEQKSFAHFWSGYFYAHANGV